MNYNYPGSISEYNMNFASTVDVVVDEKNELFNAISIYVPMSLAEANILDFDPSWVSAGKPAVITCTLDSYKKYMKGKLLDQWQDVFRQDTNFDVILYLIVFLDNASTDNMWDIDDASITFGPITEAFNKLYYISFVKTLFDETYDGSQAGSKFFDYSLALAYMCKQDLKLSYYINMVKITYVDEKPNPADACWIRYKTSAEEKEIMLSVKDGDRAKYYWGALFLMNCVQNIWTLVHSEPVNIVPLVFAAWFAERNSSGNYVGNKFSMLRLRGTRIKPCGFPSWLNSEVNQNDRDGIEVFQAKNVGFLRTIADNTPQESCVDSARSINGTPVGAQMISKWVDYTCAQQTAKFVTDDGTVTDPVLTNEDAYGKIQGIVSGNLMLFTGMKRVSGIALKFPAFTTAKVGPRELKAARVWSAIYVDDLDKVTMTGGMIA